MGVLIRAKSLSWVLTGPPPYTTLCMHTQGRVKYDIYSLYKGALHHLALERVMCMFWFSSQFLDDTI